MNPSEELIVLDLGDDDTAWKRYTGGVYRLRVSATYEHTLDVDDNASSERPIQYSLTLRAL